MVFADKGYFSESHFFNFHFIRANEKVHLPNFRRRYPIFCVGARFSSDEPKKHQKKQQKNFKLPRKEGMVRQGEAIQHGWNFSKCPKLLRGPRTKTE